MYLARGQIDHEQYVVHDEAAAGPDLDRKEVRGRQAIPMSLQKGAPGGPFPTFWCRLDAMSLKDIADRGAANIEAEIRQGSPDGRVTPVRVLFGET